MAAIAEISNAETSDAETSDAKPPRLARLAAATVAAALTLPALVCVTRADAPLPASVTAVRNAVVAMALADAAMPFATAVATASEDGSLPASSAAMKAETAGAMAAVKPAPQRNVETTYLSAVSYERAYDRRARTFYYPLPLILGIGY